MGCPNKSLKEYQDLIAEFGEGKALAAFVLYGEDIPTVEQARQLFADSRAVFDKQVERAAEKFGLKKVVKNHIEGYVSTKTNSAGIAQVDNMNKWFQQNKEKYPTLGARIDPGNPVIIFGNRIKLASDVTDRGKIINVNFPITEGDRSNYNRRVEDIFADIFKDKRILFAQGSNLSSITSSALQSIKEPTERLVQVGKQLLQLSESSANVSEIMEKTLPELFSDYINKGNNIPLDVLGYFIASRLLQSSDSFSGRVLASLSKDKLVSSSYIRLENDPEQGLFYVDGEGLYINIAKLPIDIDRFNNVEDFIKAIELILTEEVIHTVAIALTGDKEMQAIYDELTPEEIDELGKTYGIKGLSPYNIAHEYIRTIIQEDIFGTSTTREMHPKAKNIIARALEYIINLFKESPTRVSQIVVKRIKDYIEGTRDNNHFQLISKNQQKSIIYERENEMGNIPSSSKGYTWNNNRLSTLPGKEKSGRSVTGRSNRSGEENGRNQGITENGTTGRYGSYTVTNNSGSSRGDDRILQGSFEQELNTILKDFAEKELDARIDLVQDIIVDGKSVAANAVTNVVNRTIQLADGKIGIDTLPEEVAHIWVHWLPKNSILLRDMMRDIRNRPLYDQVMAEYKNNSHYQNKDGTVNEDKIAIEAIGKMIAGAIVEQYKDKKAQTLLQRLVQWIKGVFKGKDLDAFQQSAKDILAGDTSALDMDDMRAANEKGEYYFQLSKEDEAIVKSQLKKATPIQQQVINDVYLEPHSRIILDLDTHIYSDLNIENPTIYTSVTTAIGGKKNFLDEDDNDPYEANRMWGNNFDGVLSDIIQGKDIRDTPSLTDSVREQIIPYLQGMIAGLTSDGSIALTQVIVADKESKVAGSIDLLLVSPFGDMKIIDLKTSWSSIYDKQYNTKYSTGEGAIITTPLSKAQSHSVQVGTYAKLVNLMGYPVGERRTYHLLVDTKDGKVTKFTDQGMLQHVPTENEALVDKIVPTVYQGKDRLAELQGRDQPQREEPVTKEQRVANAEELQQRVLYDILPAYESWRDYLDNLQNTVGYIPEDSTIRKVNDLIHHMEQEYTETGGYSRIYTKFLTTTQSHLNGIMKYLTNPDNIVKDDYVRGIFLAKKYLDTFKDLFHTEKFADIHQQKLYVNVEQTKRDVEAAIVQAIKDHTEELLAGWSTNPKYTDPTPITLEDGTTTTKGQLALIADTTRNKDINQATMLADTIGNSGVPLLENTGKVIAAARAQVIENTHIITERIKEAGNNLIAAMGTSDPKQLYGFMFQKGYNGKKNGQIISQIGTAYKEAQSAVLDPLFNLDGSRKEYIPKPVTDEDLQWNKDLYYLKLARTEFVAPEIVDGNYKTGKVTSGDGDYHMLTEEFKEQRKVYMRQDPKQYGKWIPKNEKDPAYLEWRAANYDWQAWVGPVVKFNKTTGKLEPTGQVTDKQDYFIKKKNSLPRMEGPSGQILWDSEYMRIMTPKTATDRAQGEFYKAYVSILKEQVQKLPPGAMQWFEQGYIPMIGANWVQMLSDKDTKLASFITDQLKNFFEITAYTNSDRIIQAPSQSIPIMYMGKLQDQKRVQAIQKEIADWGTKKGNKTGDALKEWHKENDRLIDMLKREANKMTADQLHPDLVKGLEAFIQMSENFNVMTAIEDKVLAVKEQLKVMEFEKKNGSTVYGPESNAYRLYEHVLNSTFYGEQASHSFTEKAINKIMKVTSAISIPLNIFGMLNNKFMARINNRIDSIGSDFFNRKAYNRMIGVYNTEHIPGYIKTRFENVGNKGYNDKKVGSKYEGLEHKFQMVRHLNTNESRVDFLAEIGGYAGYEAGEWEVQSLVGNAILDSIQMKYTGNDPKLQDCSVYDAHKFNPNTGKTELIEGYKYLNKDGSIAEDQKKAEYLIINRIHETNDRIHGNYDPANKIMLERNYAGKLILQFHKWVYPNFKSRYQSGKFDENLGGGMDIEGRYQSLWTFIKAITKLGVSADRWNELTDHQRSNLKKDLADAIYICSLFAFATIVRSATEGLGDDDPYVKRMKNWLLYQSDRGLQEVSVFVPGFGLVESYQLASNPFAATGTLRNFAIILKDSFEYPFQDDAHRYIQRGNFKGESHLYNNLQKVVPIEKELRQWENLQSISSFYLGNSK